MVSDTEPRYRLVDADGNVVGSLYAESDGTLKLQEGTSGSDNELPLQTDGTVGDNTTDFQGDTVDANSVSTDDASIANAPTGDDDALRWQEGVESGAVTLSGAGTLSGASDGTWDTTDTDTQSETFDDAFGATPDIALGWDISASGETSEVQIIHQSKSTTGFTVRYTQYGTTDLSGDLVADYIATEGR